MHDASFRLAKEAKMPDRQPTETRNLDRYGTPPVSWARARNLLETAPQGPSGGFFLATANSAGRPHAAGVGVVVHDGDLYFTSGPGTRKSRDLKANPTCSIAVKLAGMDLTLDGEAVTVTDPSTVETLAARYRDLGWPAHVDGSAFTAPYSAPSAGPPPWNLYRFTYTKVVGLSTADGDGATLWRFGQV
jgi:hypothetical protein